MVALLLSAAREHWRFVCALRLLCFPTASRSNRRLAARYRSVCDAGAVHLGQSSFFALRVKRHTPQLRPVVARPCAVPTREGLGPEQAVPLSGQICFFFAPFCVLL